METSKTFLTSNARKIIDESSALRNLFFRARQYALNKSSDYSIAGWYFMHGGFFNDPSWINEFSQSGKLAKSQYDELLSKLMISEGFDEREATLCVANYIKELIPIVAEPWEVSLSDFCKKNAKRNVVVSATATFSNNGISASFEVDLFKLRNHLFETIRTPNDCPVKPYVQSLYETGHKKLGKTTTIKSVKTRLGLEYLTLDELTDISIRGKIFWTKE